MERSTLCCVFVLSALCAVCASPYVVIKPEMPKAGPLLGSREKMCTWGPSYWCTNITTAKGCGAVRHCIQTVWEHQVLPEDNDDICTICKNMVQQARDQLESNETQEDLKEVFEGSCNLIPLKPIAKGCDKLVDEFIPELVETLSSQMNPQVVCSVAGLCNNAEIDKMLAATSKTSNSPQSKVGSTMNVTQCDGCSHVISRMGRNFQAADRDELLNKLLEVCGHMSSLSDGCSSIIISHFNDIYDSLDKAFMSGQTCELMQLCSINEKKGKVNVEVVNESSVGVVPVEDDMTCQFCERMVIHLRDILVANTTEDEFEQVLHGLCKQMSKIENECLGFVDEYYGMIYNFLVNHLDGKEICSLAGMCPQPGKMTLESAPIWPILPADLIVQDALSNHKSAAKDVPVVQISVSSDSASAQVKDPVSMQLPIERMTPHFLVTVGTNKEACEFCEYFLHFVQKELADNRNEEAVKGVVEKACDHLPKSIGTQCKDFVDQYGNAFIAILVQEIDPSIICPGMGICPSQNGSEVVLVGGYDQYDDKPGCPLCLLAVEQLDSVIKNNKTEENIKSALESLCSHLPKSLVGECDTFVDTYSEQLVDMLIADFTPQEVCVYIKLCSPSKSSHLETQAVGDVLTNEVPQYENEKLQKMKTKEDPQCVICEFVMSRLESLLKQNATEQEVKEAVHSICNHLPKTVSPQCNKFVDQYADLVITILTQTLDPRAVCSSLKLCKPDSLQLDRMAFGMLLKHTKKSVEECALCEGLVQAVDTYLQDPKVENKVDEILKNGCQYLPSKFYSKCKNFIQVYGPSIQNIVAEFPGAPHLICEKIGVCLRPVGSVDLLGGRMCSSGPGYWCQSRDHAMACGPGPVHYCQEEVWKKSQDS